MQKSYSEIKALNSFWYHEERTRKRTGEYVVIQLLVVDDHVVVRSGLIALLDGKNDIRIVGMQQMVMRPLPRHRN